MYSILHEGGHALYEIGIDKKYQYTLLNGGASSGFHESQSRFFENYIGRDKEFIKVVYPMLDKLFCLSSNNITEEDIYLKVNESIPSLIRMDADELSYPIHILIRYELEKELINSDLCVLELPKMFNQKMREYIGIEVPNDTMGILQDVQWSGGSFGYFPTYALGNAYAAQILYALKKKINIEDCIKRFDFSTINEWLRTNIYCYGKEYNPDEILKRVTCEEFNPQYYIEYLEEKFSKIYDL